MATDEAAITILLAFESAGSGMPFPGLDGLDAANGPRIRSQIAQGRNSGAFHDWTLSTADISTLRDVVPKLYDGNLSDGDAARLAPCLGQAFGDLLNSPQIGAGTMIRLEAPEDPRLLADLPWEWAKVSAQDGTPPLLGDRPVERVIAPTGVANFDKLRLRTRPQVLLAVANVPAMADRDIRPSLFVPGISNVLRSAPPFLVVRELGLGGSLVNRESLHAAVRAYAPNIVVLVAHGRSEQEPIVLFDAGNGAIDPVPATEIGRILAASDSCVLAVLLCCDLVRQAAGTSGALSLLAAGIPEVIAMQGEIPQDQAAKFVKQALVSIYFERQLARAARTGRGVITSLHRGTPVAFGQLDEAIRPRWAEVPSRYRNAISRLMPNRYPALRRKALDANIRELLTKNGIFVVRAPIDPSGMSEFAPFADVVRSEDDTAGAGPLRPALFVDATTAEGTGNAAPWAPMFEAIRKAVATAGDLLEPVETVLRQEDPVAAASLFIEFLDAKGAILILRPVAAGGPEMAAFWDQLAKLDSQLRRSLLLLIDAPALFDTTADMTAICRFDIPVLDEAEIQEQINAHIPGFLSPQEIFLATGGNPFLLNGLVEMARKTGASAEYAELLHAKAGEIAARFMELLLTSADAEARAKILALSFVRCPASAPQVLDLLLGNDVDLFDHLRAIGYLVSAGHERPGAGTTQQLCFVPSQLADAAAREFAVLDDHFRTTARRIASSLDEAQIERTASHPGGIELLKGIQELLNNLSEDNELAKAAIFIGFMAVAAEQVTAEPSRRTLLEMIRTAAALAKKIEPPESQALHDVVYEYARIAVSLADYDCYEQARQDLINLGGTADPLIAARLLVLEAQRIKDQEQSQGADKILQHLTDAKRLLMQIEPPDADVDQELRKVNYEALKLLLFLKNEDPESEAGQASIKELLGPSSSTLERLVYECTLAEAEMRRDPRSIDWGRVKARVEDVDDLPRTGDPESRSYCMYQFAQYQWRRPDRRPAVALDAYERTETVAGKGGIASRQALALYRQMEILLGSPDLQEDRIGNVRQRIDELLGKFSAAPGDALGARAFGRLLEARARLEEPHSGAAAEFHRRAATAFSAKPLKSRGDDLWLARSAAQYLEIMLPLSGSRRPIRTFLRENESSFRDRLKIEIDRDHPEAVLAGLKDFMENSPLNER